MSDQPMTASAPNSNQIFHTDVIRLGNPSYLWCAPITASVASRVALFLSAIYSSKFICSFFARAASRIAFMRSISASGISDRSSIRSETSATR